MSLSVEIGVTKDTIRGPIAPLPHLDLETSCGYFNDRCRKYVSIILKMNCKLHVHVLSKNNVK